MNTGRKRKGLTRTEKAALRAELRTSLKDAHRTICEVAELRDELRDGVSRIEAIVESLNCGTEEFVHGLASMNSALSGMSEEI